jgi:hypothetical protein
MKSRLYAEDLEEVARVPEGTSSPPLRNVVTPSTAGSKRCSLDLIGAEALIRINPID